MAESENKPKIVLATFGTVGDLHPFLALALALKARGAEPIIAAAEIYREKVEGERVGFQPMRPDIETLGERLRMSERAIARAAARRPDFIVRELVLPHLRESFEDVMSVAQDADLIVTHSVAYGAHLAAVKCHLPWISVALQPMIFFSIYDPPILANAPALSKWLYRRGPAWTRCAFGLSKRLARRWARPIESLRRELGLPASDTNPILEGQFSPLGTLALYSPVFGSPQADHPPNTSIVGFAFHEEPDSRSECIEDFLAAGERPIVFTQGTSAVHDADTFMRESLAAVETLGRRAIFVLDETRAREWRARANSAVLITGYAPYSDLFPRADLIVHHGGIGTTAQALRSGRPQLIVPYLADQPDNAVRVERLGCGCAIPQNRYKRKRVLAEIEALLGSSAYARNAQDIARVVAQERGAERAAEIILRVLDSRARQK